MKIRSNINIQINGEPPVEICNQIKSCALNMLRDSLKGTVTDSQIKYLAWGSSSTANNAAQTTLVAEFGRVQVTTQTAGATGIVVTVTYVPPDTGNTPKIEELGWFAGAAATGTANTGILVGRVLYSHQKTIYEAIQITRTDTFTEV